MTSLPSLDSSQLPAAPQLLIQLVEICTKQVISFDELEAVISKDAALTAKIISIANSAAYSQWNNVPELKRILVVLGTKTVKTIALTAAVHQFFSKFEPKLGKLLSDVWLNSLICAELSKMIAELVGYENVDEAHLVGLLHNIGQLVLINGDHESYLQLLQSSDHLQTLLFEEHKTFGIHNADLAGNIFFDWGLAKDLENAVRYQHADYDLMLDMPVLPKLINLASKICLQEQQGMVQDHFFGLSQDIIDEMLLKARTSAIEKAQSFGIKVEQNNKQPSVDLDNDQVRIKLAKQVHQISLIDGSQNELLTSKGLPELVQAIGNQLNLIFGFSSAEFYLTNDQNSIISAYIIAENRLDDSRQIMMQENQSLIAQSLISDQITFSNQPENEQPLSINDQQVIERLKTDVMVCLPLRLADVVIGIVCAACSQQKAETLYAEPQLLKYYCLSATKALQAAMKNEQEQNLLLEQSRIESELETRSLVHEVSNPLTIISNYLEVLTLENESQSAQHTSSNDHLTIIKSEIERIGSMLIQFRDKATTASDGVAVSVNDTLQNLINLLEPSFFKIKNITNTLSFDENVPNIECDQNKLKQIFINLLKNAAEALAENGEIIVQTKALVISDKKQYVEIKISDNGTGVPAHLLGQLFTPVQTTKGDQHSGLGLSIVHSLVQSIKGKISYSTSYKGGAEFILLIPRIETQ